MKVCVGGNGVAVLNKSSIAEYLIQIKYRAKKVPGILQNRYRAKTSTWYTEFADAEAGGEVCVGGNGVAVLVEDGQLCGHGVGVARHEHRGQHCKQKGKIHIQF